MLPVVVWMVSVESGGPVEANSCLSVETCGHGLTILLETHRNWTMATSNSSISDFYFDSIRRGTNKDSDSERGKQEIQLGISLKGTIMRWQ